MLDSARQRSRSIFAAQLSAERWVARRHRGRSTRVAVRASRDLTPAAPAPPRGVPATIPHYPAPRFPTSNPARPTSWRWCQHGQASVVRAAQPATQADAAARPEGCGHFAVRSRHGRSSALSWRRSLAASRWVARKRCGRSEHVAIRAVCPLAPAAPAPRGAPATIPHYPAPRFPTIPRAAYKLALVSAWSNVRSAGRPTRHSSRRRCAAHRRRPFCNAISTRT